MAFRPLVLFSSKTMLLMPRKSCSCSCWLMVELQVLKFLESEELHVTHYGLGLKGLLALCGALEVSHGWVGVVSVTGSIKFKERIAGVVLL